MLPPPLPKVCPFCGVPTDVPHESQAGCIEALHAEIARVRAILKYVKDPQSRPGAPTARSSRGGVGLESDEDAELT
jgi:hypothetical protein